MYGYVCTSFYFVLVYLCQCNRCLNKRYQNKIKNNLSTNLSTNLSHNYNVLVCIKKHNNNNNNNKQNNYLFILLYIYLVANIRTQFSLDAYLNILFGNSLVHLCSLA